MPLKQSRFWMFWGIMITVLAICLFNTDFFFKGREPQKVAIARTEPKQASEAMEIGSTIDFTKKASCRHNVQVVNTIVELWYLQHDGQWPRSDMGDIGRDIDYFPKGIPRCPVTGESYRLDPTTHWVMGHGHGDIPDIQEPLAGANDSR